MANDDEKVIPAHVAIVSPSGEVLNKPPKPAKYGPDGRRIRPPADFMQGVPTRNEVADHLAAGVLEVGQKMYDQLSGETAEYLEEMEQAIYERVMRELEARSWPARLRQWWWKVHPPKLIVSNTESTTAAVEAMDPNVEPRPQLTMGMVKEAFRQVAEQDLGVPRDFPRSEEMIDATQRYFDKR